MIVGHSGTASLSYSRIDDSGDIRSFGVIGSLKKKQQTHGMSPVEKSTCKHRGVCLRYGVVANIIASHAIARGSIPRVGSYILIFSERSAAWLSLR